MEEVLGPKIVADFKNRVFDDRAYAVLRDADYLRAMDATPRQREQLATIQSRREQELRQHEQRRNEESLDVLSRGQQKKLRAELQRREDAAGKDGGAYASPFLPVPTPTSAAIRGAHCGFFWDAFDKFLCDTVADCGALHTFIRAARRSTPSWSPWWLRPGGSNGAGLWRFDFGNRPQAVGFHPVAREAMAEMTAKYSEALEGPSPPRDRASLSFCGRPRPCSRRSKRRP